MLPMDEIDNFEGEFWWFDEYLRHLESYLENDFASDHLDGQEITPMQEVYVNEPEYYLEALDWHRNLLRRSFLISIYSYMEHKLVMVCRAKEKTSHCRLSDVKARNDLERVRKFCLEELHVEFPEKTPEWREIKNYRLLRNCIVHHSSMIDEDYKSNELMNYLIKKRGLLTIYSNEIFIEKGYCEEVNKTMWIFLYLFLFGDRPPD